MRKFGLICLLAMASSLALAAQTAITPATAAGTTLTLNAPAACVAGSSCTATVWLCAGAASACPLTGSNWTAIKTVTSLVAGTPGTFTDTAEPLGAPVTYTVQFSQGSTVGSPLAAYTGTPVSPLAGGSFSGATS